MEGIFEKYSWVHVPMAVVNIHSTFSCIYHYTVDKFHAVAVLPINIHVIICIVLWYV